MPNFFSDRPHVVFGVFALVVDSWAVLDTRRFLRLLSMNRKVTFTPVELLVIRVPGTVVILSLGVMLLAALLRKS